jgi:hypothetical protein
MRRLARPFDFADPDLEPFGQVPHPVLREQVREVLSTIKFLLVEVVCVFHCLVPHFIEILSFNGLDLPLMPVV